MYRFGEVLLVNAVMLDGLEAAMLAGYDAIVEGRAIERGWRD